jgi:hypothetical protein
MTVLAHSRHRVASKPRAGLTDEEGRQAATDLPLAGASRVKRGEVVAPRSVEGSWLAADASAQPGQCGIGLEDLLHLRRQLLLSCGLTWLPRAGLIPDRPPPSADLPGWVDRDSGLHLEYLIVAAGGVASGTGRKHFGVGASPGLPGPGNSAHATPAGFGDSARAGSSTRRRTTGRP